jgi:hypothetical protein
MRSKTAKTSLKTMFMLTCLFSWSCESKKKVEEASLLQATQWLGMEFTHPEQLKLLTPTVRIPSNPRQAHSKCGEGWARFEGHIQDWPVDGANLAVALVARQDKVVLVSLHPHGWQPDKHNPRDRILRAYPDIARNHWEENCKTITFKDSSSTWQCEGYSAAVEYVGEQVINPFESSPESRLAQLRTPERLVETENADGAYGYHILLFQDHETLTQWFELLHQIRTARLNRPDPESALLPCTW